MINILLNRIDINPEILCGQPVIKGTRIPIYIILKALKSLKRFEDVKKQYPGIIDEDIQAALEFASELTNFTEYSIAQEG